MKAIAQKLVIGLLVAGLMFGIAGMAQAAPPWFPPHPWHPGPWGHPGPWHPGPWNAGWHPGPHFWHPPMVVYRPRPIFVEGVNVVDDVPASNPAPLADIQLINPAANRVTLTYTLDNGEAQTLPAGYSTQINQMAVIEFDRGGGAGLARYSLMDGVYQFTATNGYWELLRQATQTTQAAQVATTVGNPVPAN